MVLDEAKLRTNRRKAAMDEILADIRSLQRKEHSETSEVYETKLNQRKLESRLRGMTSAKEKVERNVFDNENERKRNTERMNKLSDYTDNNLSSRAKMKTLLAQKRFIDGGGYQAPKPGMDTSNLHNGGDSNENETEGLTIYNPEDLLNLFSLVIDLSSKEEN